MNAIVDAFADAGLNYRTAFERDEDYLVPTSFPYGKCYDTAAIVVTLGRAAGIPMRMATGRAVAIADEETYLPSDESWTTHVWAEGYITPAAGSEWTDTDWYVYDAVNNVWGPYGCESDRVGYAEVWHPSYVLVGDTTSDMYEIDVSVDYGL